MHLVGVMGPFVDVPPAVLADAYLLGQLIARRGWALLTGGRPAGVMDAASQGAKQAGGLTIGIIPTTDPADVSPAVDVAIYTGMGSARNAINALSSQALVVCGMSPGTSAEVSLALRYERPVILLDQEPLSNDYFKWLGGDGVSIVASPEDAIRQVSSLLRSGYS